MSHWKTTVILVSIGVLVAVGCLATSMIQSQETSPLLIGACIGGLVALLAVVLRPPNLTQLEAENESQNRKLEAETARAKASREELEAFRAELENALNVRGQRLDAREVELDNRLITFQEWLEYPQPEVEGAESEAVSTSDLAEDSPAELSEKDQQVHDLLEAESSALYGKLKDGFYKGENGKFDPAKARDDVLALVTRVAKIYRPESVNPLLETSVEQLLRAGSRTCLHLLIVLERLPLNMKDANFATVHGHLTTAVKAYDVYRSAEPWLGYANKAMYGARMVAGANPVTLGLTWVLSELGKAGVKHAAKKFVDHQAVNALHDLVRVIGFEVAAIYGGDFRYRDPNWVYASELTALMSRFPVSRESLAHSLREIGALPMRNEYDRVFLYRCLSSHKSPQPLIDARKSISQNDRQEVAKKLERFFRTFVHGKTKQRAEEWLDDLESRLGVRLAIPELEHQSEAEFTGADNDRRNAAASLAGFLVGVKARPLAEMRERLAEGKTLGSLDTKEASKILDELALDPSQFFEPPDLDASSDALDDYFEDLIDLAVLTPPQDVQADDLILETATYFGRDVKKTRSQIDRQYVELIATQLPSDAPSRKVEAAAARLLVAELGEEESPLFVYPSVSISPATGAPRLPESPGNVWLAGTDSRLMLLSEKLGLLCSADPSSMTVEKVDGMVIDDCRLTGTWKLADDSACSLSATVTGAVVTRYDSYFRALVERTAT
jgi:hypothetical protein